MTQGFDDESWRMVADALAPLASIKDMLVKFGEAQDSGNAEYDAYTIRIPRGGQAIQLLGFDLSRVTAHVVSSELGVFIGKREILDGASVDRPDGYPVPQSGGRTITTVQSIYIKFVGTAATVNATADISVWVEKSANAN